MKGKLAFRSDGRINVLIPESLAQEIPRLQLAHFWNDEKKAVVELVRSFHGNKGKKLGKERYYIFSSEKRKSQDHTFGTVPAAISGRGDQLILEVDKTQKLEPLERAL